MRLTKEQWAEIRARWEMDSRDGYEWLIKEMGLDINPSSIIRKKQRNGWKKNSIQKIAKAVETPMTKANMEVLEKQSDSRKAMENSNEKDNEKGNDIAIDIVKDNFSVNDFIEPEYPEKELAELDEKEKLFVHEYLQDFNASRASKIVGYKYPISLKNLPNCYEVVKKLVAYRCHQLALDPNQVLNLWAQMIAWDANELSRVWVHCCPVCWAKNVPAQMSAMAINHWRLKWEDKESKLEATVEGYTARPFPEDKYEVWDKRKEPNPDCPECHGNGDSEIVYGDTKNLSPIGKIMFNGVTQGKLGLNFILMSKENALKNLATALELFREKQDEQETGGYDIDALNRLFYENMRKAHEKQLQVYKERGFSEDAEILETEMESDNGEEVS